MKRFQIRRVRTVLLAMSVLVACSKNPAPSGMPGALSKAVSAYTGDEFHDFVSKLQYTGGHERERQCKNDPACAGTKRTVVRVDAIATEDSLGVTNTPQFGVVYARAINKGDAEETRYG
ncbi:MAG: hypothetical protein ABJE47_19190, partial [bacterium]